MWANSDQNQLLVEESKLVSPSASNQSKMPLDVSTPSASTAAPSNSGETGSSENKIILNQPVLASKLDDQNDINGKPPPATIHPSTPELQPDLPVPSTDDNNFFKQSPSLAEERNNALTTAVVAQFSHSSDNPHPASVNSSPGSSIHSHPAVHPLLKQQAQTPFASSNSQVGQSSPTLSGQFPSPSASVGNAKFKARSGGRPKDPVWVYFHTNGSGTDEPATCKYCGWHVERPKAFRMRDHIAQCAQVTPIRRAEMCQLIASKEAAAAAKQEEKAIAGSSSSGHADLLSSAAKKRKMEPIVQPKPTILSTGKSPITSHVLDATSGKPGDDMGIRLDRLTANGFVLIANGVTDADGRCNNLLPSNVRPEMGIYKVTFFSNEFYLKRGIVSFYPFVEITFEIKDPTEHYHVPLLLSPYAFSTYRGS